MRLYRQRSNSISMYFSNNITKTKQDNNNNNNKDILTMDQGSGKQRENPDW